MYDSLKNVRYQYVAMRARSEVIWRKFITTQVEPLITGSTPAWKEKLTDPTPFITDEDIKTMKDVLSLFGVPVPPSANFEGQPTPEENYDEPEQVADDNDPVEVEGAGEGEGEGENQQEVADQVTQSLKQKFGKHLLHILISAIFIFTSISAAFILWNFLILTILKRIIMKLIYLILFMHITFVLRS